MRFPMVSFRRRDNPTDPGDSHVTHEDCESIAPEKQQRSNVSCTMLTKSKANIIEED